MSTRKRFKEYTSQTNLSESTWLSKGYAVGQGARHESVRRQLESLTKRIHSLCEQGKLEDDFPAKINLLFQAIAALAETQKLGGDLSRHSINVSIASNLLEDDLKTIIQRQLPKHR